MIRFTYEHGSSTCLFATVVIRYLVPSGVALFSYTARWLTDATCSVNVCRSASEALSHVYIVVFVFIGIVAATKFKQIKDSFVRLKKAFDVMTNEKTKKD
jgi:hypothetical protein